MQETQFQSLGGEDALEKKMATLSSILAWKIPWAEEPGRLQSMGSQRVGHNWATSPSLSINRKWWYRKKYFKQKLFYFNWITQRFDVSLIKLPFQNDLTRYSNDITGLVVLVKQDDGWRYSPEALPLMIPLTHIIKIISALLLIYNLKNTLKISNYFMILVIMAIRMNLKWPA